jgi:2-keto-4-pentenoate hydratase
MDVNMAYEVQKAYVEKRLSKEKIAGFKAGLTSEGGQKAFGVDAPLAGVLFESGKLMGDATVDTGMFTQLMLETEIGFVIGKAIPQSLNDVTELQEHINAVMPVIELPDLGFADMKQLKGVDIIAANVAAKQFILGQEKAVDGIDLNAVTVSLFFDGQEVNTGKGTDALGDQWQAALWLVNTMVEQGWKPEPGHIAITGALGKILPGKPGKYVADYGNFGKIAFEIK